MGQRSKQTFLQRRFPLLRTLQGLPWWSSGWLYTSNAGDQSLIPVRGTRSHMLQLKIQHAIIKTEYNQINDLKKLCYLYKHIKKKTPCCSKCGPWHSSHSLIWKLLGFPSGSESKDSACNSEDLGSICGSGRSPGEGNDNPLKYSCLEDPMDRGAWWAIVNGVA